MYNLRYHVASLAAVFLALAVGLVLGTIVAERGTLTRQGSALVKDLQTQYDAIKQDNADLRTGLERDRAFVDAAVPVLVSGALEETSVVVLTSAGRTDGLTATSAALDEAGAVTVPASLRRTHAGLDSALPDEVRTALAAASAGQLPAPGSAELLELVAATLAEEWTNPGERPVTDALGEAGTVAIEGLASEATVGGLVIMAAEPGGLDPFVLALGTALREAGVAVVGAEAVWRDGGVAEACAEAGFSAVDNVGTPQGRFSLVAVLAGGVDGHFGEGSSAEAVFAPAGSLRRVVQ